MSNSTYYKPPVKFTLPVGSEATPENIAKAVKELESRKARYEQLHNYYIGNQEILNRTLSSETAKNNKLVNNFASYIALLLGVVDYIVPDDLDLKIDGIMQRYAEQTMSDLDAQIALDAAIYGVAYDLTFTDEDSEANTVQVDPRNTLVVYDDSVQHRELFAINCAQVKDKEGKVINRVTAYTPEKIIEMTLNADGGAMDKPEEKPHFFGAVPVVTLLNTRWLSSSVTHVVRVPKAALVNSYSS